MTTANTTRAKVESGTDPFVLRDRACDLRSQYLFHALGQLRAWAAGLSRHSSQLGCAEHRSSAQAELLSQN